MAIAEIFQLVTTLGPFFSEQYELTSPFTQTTVTPGIPAARSGWTTLRIKGREFI